MIQYYELANTKTIPVSTYCPSVCPQYLERNTMFLISAHRDIKSRFANLPLTGLLAKICAGSGIISKSTLHLSYIYTHTPSKRSLGDILVSPCPSVRPYIYIICLENIFNTDLYIHILLSSLWEFPALKIDTPYLSRFIYMCIIHNSTAFMGNDYYYNS